jgi:hypothetical protein
MMPSEKFLLLHSLHLISLTIRNRKRRTRKMQQVMEKKRRRQMNLQQLSLLKSNPSPSSSMKRLLTTRKIFLASPHS